MIVVVANQDETTSDARSTEENDRSRAVVHMGDPAF